MNPKPIFSSKQAEENETKVQAVAYSSSAIFMGGYMKDPTLSPMIPAGSKFPFIGAMSPTTQVWVWLLVDSKSANTPEVKALVINGANLLVVLEDTSPSTLIMEVSTADGIRTSPSIIQVLNYKAPTLSAAYLGTKVFVIANDGPKSILAELDMSKTIFQYGDTNVRFLQDNNNNINMHLVQVSGSFIFIAQTANLSSTTVPTTNVPAVHIEMVTSSTFSTSTRFVIHCSCFSQAYPKISQMQISGSYTISGALTFASMTEVHIFTFTTSSISPYAITSSTIKTIPGQSVLAMTKSGSNSIYLLEQIVSGTSSIYIVSTDFTTITSTLVSQVVSPVEALNLGAGVFGSSTMAFFSAIQTQTVKKAFLYKTTNPIVNFSTCQEFISSAGTVAFGTPSIPAFASWDAVTMSWPASHTTGSVSNPSLLKDLRAQFLPASNLGSQYCSFETIFTMTDKNTSLFEFIYELDAGGLQTYPLIAASILTPSCSDQAGNIHYYIESIEPALPAGIQLTFTEGALPVLNCKGYSNPSGPFAVEIGTYLKNGQTFAIQTVQLYLNSVKCETAIAPLTSLMIQTFALGAAADAELSVAPLMDLTPPNQNCVGNISLISANYSLTQLPAPEGLFLHNALVQADTTDMGNSKLTVGVNTLPYDPLNADLYNITMQYKIGKLVTLLPFYVLLTDPCEAARPTIFPAFNYTGENAFVLNPESAPIEVQFGITLTIGLEWCKFDLDLRGMGPFFLGAQLFTGITMADLPVTLTAQVNVYDQEFITAPGTVKEFNMKLGKTLIEVSGGFYYEVVDPCLENFTTAQIADTVSFWGDPSRSSQVFPTAIEKQTILFCRISSSVSVTRVGGGTIKPGLITYTQLTYANRTEYLSNLLHFNYAISDINDIGTYVVTINFGWEDNITWEPHNFQLEEKFSVYMKIIDKVQDICTVLVQPLVSFTRNVYLMIKNKPIYIYPTTSINYPQCSFNLTCTMNYDGGSYKNINAYTGFTGPNLTGYQQEGTYADCLISNILGDFEGNYNKTLQGIYNVKVHITWASGTMSADYELTIHLRDPCGIPPQPDKGIRPLVQQNLSFAMLNPYSLFTGSEVSVLYTIYDNFCHYKFTTSVVKVPALPDTRSIVGSNTGEDEIYEVKWPREFGVNRAYDWDNVGDYIITSTLQWQSDEMDVFVQDFAQVDTQTFTWTITDPCWNKTTIPATLADRVVPLLSTLSFSINPTQIATFEYCWCSISANIQKAGVTINDPLTFQYKDLIKANVTTWLPSTFVVDAPVYNLELVGTYNVTVTYQWTLNDITTRTFKIDIIDPCVTKVIPPASVANITMTTWGATYQANLAVTIGSAYQMCKYSITAAVIKTPAPDTSASVVTWTNMIDEVYANTANAVMYFMATYEETKVGVYSVTVTYTWGMPVQTLQKIFQATLIDSCVSGVQARTNGTNTYDLGGSNVTSYFRLQPTFSTGSSFCLVTTAITAVKTTNNPPDTTANVFAYTSLTKQASATHLNTFVTISLNTYELTYLGTYTLTAVHTWGNPVKTGTTIRTIVINDGCLNNVTPPASIANTQRSLLDFDDAVTWKSVAPTISTPFSFCRYSISWTAAKTTNPDTTSSAISFTAMFQEVYANLGLAVIHYIGGSNNYNLSLIGDYSIKMTYSWGGANVDTQVVDRSFTFTIVDPCITAIVPPASIPNFEAFIGNADYTENMPPTISAPFQSSCIFSLSLTSSKEPLPDTSTTAFTFSPLSNVNYLSLSSAKVFYKSSVQNLAHTGVYTMIATYTWGGYGADTSTTRTFTFTLKDPCISQTPPTFVDQNSVLVDPDPNFLVTPTMSTANYMWCQVSIALTITKGGSDDTTGFATFTNVSSAALSSLTSTRIQFNTSSYDLSHLGVYYVTLSYSWSGPSTGIRSFKFTVTDPCLAAVVPPATPASYAADIGGQNYTVNIAPTIAQAYRPYCVFSIILSSTKSPLPDTSSTAISFEPVVNKLYADISLAQVLYNVSVQNVAHEGVYTITLTYTWGGAGAEMSSTLTPFTLTLTNSCLAYMTIPSFTSTTATLVDPNTSFFVTPTLSQGTYTWCQVSINLTLTKNAVPNSDGFVSWSDVANQPISSLATTEILFNTAIYVATYIGEYSVKLTYTWSGPSILTRSFTFTVLDPCISTIVPPVSIPDYSAYIGDPNYVQNIAPAIGATYQAHCVYSIALTATKVPLPNNYVAAMTYTNQVNVLYTDLGNSKITYNASIFDQAIAGVYTVTLTYMWAGSGAAQSSSLTFKLTLTIDPLNPPYNRLPYFSPRLPSQLSIDLVSPTFMETPWSFNLPTMKDDDKLDKVILQSYNFMKAGVFLSLNDNSLEVQDIRKTNSTKLETGFYPLFFYLTDGKNTSMFTLPLFVNDPYNETITEDETFTSGLTTDSQLQQKQMTDKWLDWLGMLRNKGIITPYEQFLMEGINVGSPTDQDQSYLNLNMTGAFDTFHSNFTLGDFWGDISEQDFMDTVTKELINWRTAVTVQRVFDKLNGRIDLKTTEPPKPYFKQITDTGRVKIGFSNSVWIVPDMKMVNNGTIYLSDLNRLGNYKRELSYLKEVEQFPVLELEVIPGSGQNGKDLTFTWNATNQTYGELTVQIYFDKPEIVSTGYTPDILKVKFNDPMLFFGVNGLVLDRGTRLIEKSLRRQVGSDFDQKVGPLADTATNVAKAVIVTSLFLNILISGLLNQFWSMIETQQLIVLLLMFNISMPANAVAFFSRLLQIASFDFVNVEPWTNYILQLEPTGALTEKFDDLGMGSTYFFNNLGSFGLIFLAYMIAVLCLPCHRLACCRKSSFVRSHKKEFKNRLKWGYLISTIRESASLIAICALINIKAIKWDFFGDYVHNSIAIGFMILISVFPFYSIWYVRSNFHARDDKRMLARFGGWYEDLDLRKGHIVLIQPLFHILRRLHLAFTVVYMEWFIGQSFMLFGQVIFSIVMVGHVRPWKEPMQWKNQLFNEMVILVVYYHLMCFTPFFPNFTQQYTVGYSIIVIVSLHIFYSIFFLIFNGFRSSCYLLRVWWLVRRMRSQSEAKRAQFAASKPFRQKSRSIFRAKMLAKQMMNIASDPYKPDVLTKQGKKKNLSKIEEEVELAEEEMVRVQREKERNPLMDLLGDLEFQLDDENQDFDMQVKDQFHQDAFEELYQHNLAQLNNKDPKNQVHQRLFAAPDNVYENRERQIKAKSAASVKSGGSQAWDIEAEMQVSENNSQQEDEDWVFEGHRSKQISADLQLRLSQNVQDLPDHPFEETKGITATNFDLIDDIGFGASKLSDKPQLNYEFKQRIDAYLTQFSRATLDPDRVTLQRGSNEADERKPERPHKPNA